MKKQKLLTILCAAAICASSFVAVHAATAEIYTTDDGTKYKYFYSTSPEHSDYFVLQYVSGTVKDVIVPDNINGVPVVSVIGGFRVTNDTLESIVVPETCLAIDGFSGYTALKSVTAEGALDYIDGFAGCESLETVTLKKGVKKIYSHAFEDCSSLKTVSSLDGLVSIGKQAFMSSGIKEITLPQTLQTIDAGAFQLTTNLKSVTIPENITSIPRIAFQESGLERVEFEGSISSMGISAFGGCENLRTVTGLTQDKIARFWDAFGKTPFQTEMIDEAHPFIVDSNGHLAAYVGKDTDVVIPNTVKTIGKGAFFAQKNITSVTIPSSVTTIESQAFYGCEGLTAITIPASVTSIKELAFSHCINLKNITFEASDKKLTIGSCAFQLAAVTKDTFVTNGRRYGGKSAFNNTALDPDFAFEPEETAEPEETTKPKETTKPEETSAPTETPEPEEIGDKGIWFEGGDESELPQDKPLESLINVGVNNGMPVITIDGETMVFPDAQPFIDSNNRTQTPIRALAEALGCTVDWNGELQRVTFTHPNGLYVYLNIGDNQLYVGNNIVNMDTAAMIINDRTYVPLRFIATAFGVNVLWDWDE